jgi:dihydrofolate synthase/folylpolyglutamate synthase
LVAGYFGFTFAISLIKSALKGPLMNNYQEAIEYLMQRLPMFARVGNEAIKKGLKNITALCKALDDPQNKFPSVHIAGTNGKGSTSHLIAAALQQQGYKTGLYTSPHLVDLRERVRINGVPVPEEFVISFVERTKPLIEEIQPSYFELNVAMAFAAFAAAKVDIAVIETGLGGRLDSTNIITPVLSVITNIGLEHTQILGDTLAEIAGEKAGIIKEHIPVVVGESHEETEPVFFLHALNKHTVIHYADAIWDMVRTGQDHVFQYFKAVHKGDQEIYNVKTDLLGSYQLHNVKTALTACELLNRSGWNLPREKVLESLSSVKSTTGLRGRWDWVQQSPNIILDVAHNPDGMKYLNENLKAANIEGKLYIVCGFVSDKDVVSALRLFPQDAVFFFTQANVPRAMPVGQLMEIAEQGRLKGSAYPTVKAAVAAAKAAAGADDTILITGSFFIVGEAMEVLDKDAVLQ